MPGPVRTFIEAKQEFLKWERRELRKSHKLAIGMAQALADARRIRLDSFARLGVLFVVPSVRESESFDWSDREFIAQCTKRTGRRKVDIVRWTPVAKGEVLRWRNRANPGVLVVARFLD